MLRKLAMLFGFTFLAIGILGFIPGITNDEDLLLGIFHVGALHNVIHILSGVLALYASKSEDISQMYFKLFGAVYGLVTIIGLIQDDTVLGLFHVNAADNWLHVLFTVLLLGIGFGVPKETQNKSQSEA